MGVAALAGLAAMSQGIVLIRALQYALYLIRCSSCISLYCMVFHTQAARSGEYCNGLYFFLTGTCAVGPLFRTRHPTCLPGPQSALAHTL